MAISSDLSIQRAAQPQPFNDGLRTEIHHLAQRIFNVRLDVYKRQVMQLLILLNSIVDVLKLFIHLLRCIRVVPKARRLHLFGISLGLFPQLGEVKGTHLPFEALPSSVPDGICIDPVESKFSPPTRFCHNSFCIFCRFHTGRDRYALPAALPWRALCFCPSRIDRRFPP